MNRRFVVLFTVLMGIVLFVAACRGATTPGTPAEDEATPLVEQETEAGAEEVEATEVEEFTELIVGVGADGYRLEGDGADLGIRPPGPANITEPLVRITTDYQIIPWLAESWEQLDETTWRFDLRQGVKFHNGDEFNAEAAKWSIDRANRWFPLFPPDEVTVLDNYTLEITTTRPFWYMAEALSHPSYAMYSPEGDPGTNPIGTGPFSLDEYQQNEFIRVVKFDDYWGEPAQLDAVTLRFIPDAGARVLALQSGDVDMILPVPRDNVPQVAAMPDVELYVSQPIGYWAIYFATKNQEPPYDLLTDVRLRQAINYAIDRETIVNQVFDGYAEAALSLMPPTVSPEIDQNVTGFTYDPDKALALFAEAGWTDSDGDGLLDKDGQPLALTLVSGFPPAEEAKPLPEVIQGQLRAIGVDAQLVEFNDVGAYYDYIIDSGEMHMIIESGSWNTPDLSFLTFTVFCGCNPEGEAVLYERFWLNDAFDQGVMDSQGAPDADAATVAAVRSAQVMVDEFTGVAPIAYVPQIGAAYSYVKSFEVHPSNYSQTWNSVFIER
ncbi:MAG TPA: ABC transporter substrate-binding protein [Anaerolineae bacterium]